MISLPIPMTLKSFFQGDIFNVLLHDWEKNLKGKQQFQIHDQAYSVSERKLQCPLEQQSASYFRGPQGETLRSLVFQSTSPCGKELPVLHRSLVHTGQFTAKGQPTTPV